MIICREMNVVEVDFMGGDESILLSIFIDSKNNELLNGPIKMTDDLRDKISQEKVEIIKAIDIKMERVFDFFKKMKNDEWFYIISEKQLGGVEKNDKDNMIARRQAYLKYKNQGRSDEYINSIMGYLAETCEKYSCELSEIYDIFYCANKNAKKWLGEANKKNRICRFCARKMPETTFKNVAHTIPLALGNRVYFSNYECDDCNHFFGEEIEPHLVGWLGVLNAIYGVKGRTGILNFKLNNGMVSYDKEDDQPVIKCKNINKGNLINNRDGSYTIYQHSIEKYIPVKVYKALVKIALGFIPEDKMHLFKYTINWLMDRKEDIDKKLPKVACCLYQQGDNQQPEIILYLRKKNQGNAPYAVASLMMCGIRLLYIIPFTLNENKDYTFEEDYNAYWNLFSLYSKAPRNWAHVDLSESEKTPVQLKLHINFVGE